MITPIASVSISRLALTKLTTIRLVAEEDWIIAVIENPVSTAKKRLDVVLERMVRIRSPASSISASLMTFMP